MALMYRGAYVHMDKQPHTCTQKSLQSSMTKENKYRHSAKDMFNRTDLKSFPEVLSVN